MQETVQGDKHHGVAVAGSRWHAHNVSASAFLARGFHVRVSALSITLAHYTRITAPKAPCTLHASLSAAKPQAPAVVACEPRKHCKQLQPRQHCSACGMHKALLLSCCSFAAAMSPREALVRRVVASPAPVLAPLTRAGTAPFRALCRRHGAEATMGEMIFVVLRRPASLPRQSCALVPRDLWHQLDIVKARLSDSSRLSYGVEEFIWTKTVPVLARNEIGV